MISVSMLEDNLRGRWMDLVNKISAYVTPETKVDDLIMTDLALLDLMTDMMDEAPAEFEGQKLFFKKLHNATTALEEKYE